MARILLVTSEFEPFQASGVNRLKFFKRSLEKNGHFVAVLTTTTKAQGLNQDVEKDKTSHIYRAFSLSLLARRLLSSRRCPIYPRLAKTGKYAVWIPFAIRKGTALTQSLAIDTIITSFPDFASLNVAEQIATKTSTRLITDFRDPPFWIYDKLTHIDSKTKKCQSIIKRTLQTSGDVITCTKFSATALTEHYGLPYNNITIANGFDQEVIDSLPSNIATNKNYFEIVHIGSFYDEGRDIRPIISAIEQYNTQHNNPIKLRLIGDKPDNKTQQFIEQHAKTFEVSIEPPVPMLEALTIAKGADALLLLQGTRFDRQIPTKIYEYLALNRPIWSVVGEQGETRKLLEKYSDNVIYSNYDDAHHIASSLAELLRFEAKEIDYYELSRQAQIEKLAELKL